MIYSSTHTHKTLTLFLKAAANQHYTKKIQAKKRSICVRQTMIRGHGEMATVILFCSNLVNYVLNKSGKNHSTYI